MEVFYIFFILFIIAFSIAITLLIGKYSSLKTKMQRDNQENKKLFEEILSNSDTSVASTKIGPQGPAGPQGPSGPPGGFFTAAGPMICMANKQVATPTFGTKEASIVYLDDKHFSPIQYWFLVSNSNGSVSVKNKYTEKCLTTNQLGDIYSDDCSMNNSQQFNWGKNMQLSSLMNSGQCVTIEDYSRNANNSNNSFNLNTLSVAPGTNNGNVQRLKLSACSSSLNPNQTWYIGH